jgi:hypothetical protein
MPPFTCLRSTRATIRIEPAEYLGETRRKVLDKILSAPIDVIPRADIVPAHYSIPPGACSRSALRTYLIHIWSPIPFCAGALRGRTPATGYNTPTAHFRNRRCLARCRRRLGRAFALKPAEEASSSRSKSAAAVPDVIAPSRTVRPPFRLFDPFSAGLCRFQPTALKAPVRTSVATEFNSGERTYSTIKPRSPSIRKPRQIQCEKLPPDLYKCGGC